MSAFFSCSATDEGATKDNSVDTLFSFRFKDEWPVIEDTISVETFKKQVIGYAWTETDAHYVDHRGWVTGANFWEYSTNASAYKQFSYLFKNDSTLTIFYHPDAQPEVTRHRDIPYKYVVHANYGPNRLLFDDKRLWSEQLANVVSIDADTMYTLRTFRLYIKTRRLSAEETQELLAKSVIAY